MTFTYLPNLDEKLISEAASHTHPLWGDGRPLEAHIARQRIQIHRAGPAILRYVGLTDETGLVASIKRYGLVVHAPGVGPVPAVGIGAVYTRSDARGKGAASTLLRAVLGEARQGGCALALLYSDIDTGFYERLGFVSLPARDHSAPTNAFPESTSLELRPASVADESQIIAFHEASWDPSFVRIVRTPEHLRYFCWRNSVDSTWMLQDGARTVGYLMAALHGGNRDDSFSPSSPTIWIDEWAAPGITTTEVFGAIRRLAEQNKAEQVAAWLSPVHALPPFVGAVRKIPIPMVCALGGPISIVDPTRTFFGSLDHF